MKPPTFFTRLLAITAIWLTTGHALAVSIQDFGAVGDGKTLNTVPIQKAVDQCTAAGGGEVTVPAGSFLTGTVFLKSNVHLVIAAGGTLLGSIALPDYQRLKAQDAHARAPIGPSLGLLLAENADNVTVSGPGTIDGQGRLLAKDVEERMHVTAFTVAESEAKRPNEKLRPQLIDFLGCKNVALRDVTLKDSASWVQTYNACVGLQLDHIRVDSTAYWNNDGIDIVDCKNVAVRHCDINSADDGICLKSHDPTRLDENIEISDCRVRSSASALKFGTASAGGFRHVTVTNLEVRDTFRSAIALESVDGGVLEDIHIRHVTATNTGNAIFIRRGQRTGTPGVVRNIVIEDVSAHLAKDKADAAYETAAPHWNPKIALLPSSITGLPDHPVEDVTLSNIEIFYGDASRPAVDAPQAEPVPERAVNYPEYSMFGPLPAWGVYARHVRGLTLKNIRLHVQARDARPPIVTDDVSGVSSENVLANEAPVGSF